jgi:hypothetical protein
MIGDVLSQSVSPAAVAAVPIGVFQTLCGGVTDRHIATKRCHNPIVAPLDKIISCTLPSLRQA